MIIKPNWNSFKAKFNENPQENFEWFCYLLFSKEYNQPYGTHRYKNQSGIETDPIQIGDEVIGWQSKFYEDSLSNHKEDLLGTLTKTKRDNPNITKIILYTNSEWGQGQGTKEPKAKTETEEKARELNIELIWRVQSYFESPFVSQEQRNISSYFFNLDVKWELSNYGFIDTLKEKYLNNFSTISLLMSDTPKPIDEIFINLAIIKDKQEEQKQEKQINREAILSSYEEIHKPKEPIEIKELINTANKSLIYGKAGIGKTTLCKYITYKWAKEELYSEFEYVVYIPLREWKTGGIKGAIKDYYYSRDSQDLIIDISSEKMLFLFDGYDELDGERKKLLRDEIDKYALTHYIITTRPYGYQKSDFSIDEQFETIGFTDEDVEKYINSFFENKEKAQKLKNYLQSNISIKHIAYIPLMLEMICSLWESEAFNDSLTMTELYSKIIKDMLNKHSASKNDERVYKRKNRKRIKEQLGKIAFEGLIKQTILLDGDLIENSIEDIDFFEENVIYSGFLKSDVEEKDLLDNQFEFPHLTFQEYFSALYVSSLSKEEQSEIIRDWKFYPHMQMFFAFLGGLIEDKEFLLSGIESEPRDLIGFYQFGLVVDCLYQIRKNELSREYIKEFNKDLKHWITITIKEHISYELILDSFYMILHVLHDEFIEELFQVSINAKNEYFQEYMVNILYCLGTKNQKYMDVLTKFEQEITYIKKVKKNEKKVTKNEVLIDEILNELDKMFLCNCFMMTILQSIDDENMYINEKSKLEIHRIFKKYEITNISEWYSKNEDYILNSSFSTINIKSEKDYFIQNSKNEFIEESLRKEYLEVVNTFNSNTKLMSSKLIDIIKNENFNWIMRGELVFLLQEILDKDKKKLSYTMLELWMDKELHEDIRTNAIKAIGLQTYDNNFIDNLVIPYKNEKNNFSDEMIDVFAMKLAEISKNNFYAYVVELNILDDDLTEVDMQFLMEYYKIIDIDILFKAYHEGYFMAYPLYINCITNNFPLYIRNDKLCTVYHNEEIITIEDVENEFLEELTTFTEGYNING